MKRVYSYLFRSFIALLFFFIVNTTIAAQTTLPVADIQTVENIDNKEITFRNILGDNQDYYDFIILKVKNANMRGVQDIVIDANDLDADGRPLCTVTVDKNIAHPDLLHFFRAMGFSDYQERL